MAEGAQRKLAAVLAADVAGYSRLMGEDEAATLEALRELRTSLFQPSVAERGGELVKSMGDGWLVAFPSVVDAVHCAVHVQDTLRKHPIIKLRVGIHIGDIVLEDEDIFGDGVNVAARLQELADPGAIALSGRAHEFLDEKLADGFTDGGAHELKNIARPVQVWQWRKGVAPSAGAADVSQPVAGFDGRPAIAVLPFENMSGDAEQEYFADGIAEDILTRLAMWRWLPVIARNSSFTFKGQNVDIMEAGQQLGARYILEGSVRKGGNRVRITGQLIDAETGHHLWADRYDGNLDDIFDLQDEITEAIVTALEPAVGQAEMKRAQQLTSAQLGAWDITQRAVWHLVKFTKEDFEAALELLKTVDAEEVKFAHAASYVSMIRAMQALFAWAENPAAALMEAAQYANRAIEIDAMDPYANAVMGFILTYQGRHDAGIELTRRATELNPSFALAYHLQGVGHMFNGEPEAGIAAINQALRLSPFDHLRPVWLSTLSAVHYLAKDYKSALEVADTAIQTWPKYVLAQRGRANALAQLGRMDEARQALADFLALSPNYTVATGRLGVAFRRDEDLQHYMDGLRMVGLPEE